MIKFVIILVLIDLCFCYTSSGYGPFDLSVKKVGSCKGPMKKDCCVVSGKIINGTIIQYEIIVKENVTNIHANLYATSIETKQTLKLQLKQLCNHPFWQRFMEKIVNFVNCHVLQGNYHLVLNIQDVARSYYAGSFIYGRWTFKTVLFNEYCNFACNVMDLVLTPKKS